MRQRYYYWYTRYCVFISRRMPSLVVVQVPAHTGNTNKIVYIIFSFVLLRGVCDQPRLSSIIRYTREIGSRSNYNNCVSALINLDENSLIGHYRRRCQRRSYNPRYLLWRDTVIPVVIYALANRYILFNVQLSHCYRRIRKKYTYNSAPFHALKNWLQDTNVSSSI